jgi:hypothetical protein
VTRQQQCGTSSSSNCSSSSEASWRQQQQQQQQQLSLTAAAAAAASAPTVLAKVFCSDELSCAVSAADSSSGGLVVWQCAVMRIDFDSSACSLAAAETAAHIQFCAAMCRTEQQSALARASQAAQSVYAVSDSSSAAVHAYGSRCSGQKAAHNTTTHAHTLCVAACGS